MEFWDSVKYVGLPFNNQMFQEQLGLCIIFNELFSKFVLQSFIMYFF